MSTFIPSAAYAASRSLATQGLAFKRSHASEVIAALLGYRTFAALTIEEANPAPAPHLDDAEIIVLNLPMGTARVAELNVQSTSLTPAAIVQTCVEALKSSISSASVYVSVEDFYDSHARQALAEEIYNDDSVASAMAESNAIYSDEPEMEEQCPPTADLWTAPDEWSIEASGIMAGEYDPDGDRMFNGDALNCRGQLTYSKAGRAGLIFAEGSGVASADDSWREPDPEDW